MDSRAAEASFRAVRSRRQAGRVWPGLLIAAVLLGLGVRALLPWALQHAAVRQLEQTLDARVELADVDLSLLSGELFLEGVSVAPSETPEDPRLRAERIRVRLARRPLLEGRFALAVVGLDGAEVVLTRGPDGELGLGIEGFGSESSEAPATEAPAADPLLLGRLNLRDTRLTIREPEGDTTLALDGAWLSMLELGGAVGWRLERFGIGELALRLPRGDEGFRVTGEAAGGALAASLDRQTPIEVRLHQGSGWLEAKGLVALAAPSAQLDLTWDDLDLGALLAALAPGSAPAVLGRTTGEGQLELVPGTSEARSGDGSESGASGGSGGEIRMRGRIEARQGEAKLAGMASRWQKLEAEIAEARFSLSGGAPRARLDRLHVQSPSLEWRPAPADAGSASGPGPRIAIASLEVDDGVVRYVDPEAPDAALALSGLRLRATGVRTPGGLVESIDLAAAGPGGGPLRVRGRIGQNDGELILEGERLELDAVAPLVAARAPYRITDGGASFVADVRLEAGDYRAPVRLVLHDLGVRVADDGSFLKQFGMPPQLALALLRDANRDIGLDFTLAGGRDGLRVGFWPTLGRALRDAVLNALQKPLSLLGRVVVREGRLADFDLSPVGFRAGTAELAGDARTQLDRTAETLSAHPGLAVELVPLLVAEDARSLGGSPAPETLRTLASERSAAVRSALEAAGIEAGRIGQRDGPVVLGAGAPRVKLVLGAAEPDVAAEAP